MFLRPQRAIRELARCLAWLTLVLPGCSSGGDLSEGWGRKGLHPGTFIRPRAMACDLRPHHEAVYVVDFTGRIQVFNFQGQYLRGWATPNIANGRPAGIGVARDGRVLVADSHYQRILIYTPDGNLLREIVGEGPAGPFAYVADVVEDAEGHLYVSEFGAAAQIRKLTPEGKTIAVWGSPGEGPGQFARPRGLAFNRRGELHVADSCNHRIQVFDRHGQWLRMWGQPGTGPGQLGFPYDVAINSADEVFVTEFGNQRVQRFSALGESCGIWGRPGRDLGCLFNPWGLTIGPGRTVFVTDTDSHRIQKFRY